MRSRRAAWTMGVARALLFSLLLAGRAQGAGSSPEPATLPIALELEGCQAIDEVELYKLLAIEFRTLGVLPAVPRERIHVACATERALVRLEFGDSSNEVQLGATAPAIWARLLALSISEIVTESHARVPKAAAPRTSSEPGPLPTSKPTPAPRDAGRFRGFAGISLRRAVRPATWLMGPDLGAMLELNPYLSVALDLRLEFGRADTPLAKIDWLSASSAVALLARGALGDWNFEFGPGVCIGYLHWSPRVRVANVTGHAVSGIWAGPELVARVRYDLSARWFALGSVDSGFSSTSVAGLVNSEQRAIDAGGVWVSAMLGTGLRL